MEENKYKKIREIQLIKEGNKDLNSFGVFIIQRTVNKELKYSVSYTPVLEFFDESMNISFVAFVIEKYNRIKQLFKVAENGVIERFLDTKEDNLQLEGEEWRDVVNYENLYEVSNLGRVRNKVKKRGLTRKILKPYMGKEPQNYLSVNLSKDGVATRLTLHRLVAFAFIPNPENKLEVNHKNGIKTDNRVENLEWVTRWENQKHSYEVLGRISHFKDRGGRMSYNAKPVYQYKRTGELIKKWDSIIEAAQELHLKEDGISECARRNKNMDGSHSSSQGYFWKYNEIQQHG